MGTLKLNVNLVDLFFTVKDKSGELVPHLTKNDCSVSEDKVPQTLKNFVAETHLPLTLGILLDTSGSQRAVLPLEQQAGGEFLQRVLKSKDQAFLLSFDVNVDLLQDFTNSPRLLAEPWTRLRSILPAATERQVFPDSAGVPFLPRERQKARCSMTRSILPRMRS